MTHIIDRRKALTAVAAVPAAAVLSTVGFCSDPKSDAAAQVEHHTREPEKAMRDLYGREVDVLRFEAKGGMVPCVFVVANGGGTAHPAKNSSWLYAGDGIEY